MEILGSYSQSFRIQDKHIYKFLAQERHSLYKENSKYCITSIIDKNFITNSPNYFDWYVDSPDDLNWLNNLLDYDLVGVWFLLEIRDWN